MCMKTYWFKAKTYGWGWYPSAWQGWLVTLGFLVLQLGNVYRLDFIRGASEQRLATEFVLETFFFVGILIWICYKTGEKPGWRWGGKGKGGKGGKV
jgi:hypothetical protein